MNSESTSVDTWHALVAFLHHQGEKKIIPVKEILYAVGPKPNRSLSKFEPKDIRDFKFDQLYKVKTALDSEDDHPHSYFCYIGRMAESKDALPDHEGRGRIHWFKYNVIDLSEPESSATDDHTDKLRGLSFTKDFKTKTKTALQNKRIAANLALEALKARNSLNENRLVMGSSRKENTDPEPQKIIEELKRTVKKHQDEVVELKSRERLRQERESLSSSDIYKQLDDMKKSIISELSEAVVNAVEERIKAMIGQRKCEVCSNSSAPSANSSNSGSHKRIVKEVGLSILEPYAFALEGPNLISHSEFCRLLLLGQFGSEAKSYRLNSKEGRLKFPDEFVLGATVLFRKFLARGNYTLAETEAHIKKFPAYLSMAAGNLEPRGMHAVRRAAMEKGSDVRAAVEEYRANRSMQREGVEPHAPSKKRRAAVRRELQFGMSTPARPAAEDALAPVQPAPPLALGLTNFMEDWGLTITDEMLGHGPREPQADPVVEDSVLISL